jgi:hypothetical protein
VTIYGVFVKERCIYVGCTHDFEQRAKAHTLRFSKLFNEKPEVKVLRRVSIDSCAYAEWSMIRMYKDLGQADFNADRPLNWRPLRGPKTQRRKERANKILAMARAGHPRKEVAAVLKTSPAEVSIVCRANGIFTTARRPKGSGVGYGIKLTRAQHEEILRRDERDISHAEIGKLFGVSRERIRQICEAAGHPTRRERQQKEMEVRKRRRRNDLATKRKLKRLTPTANTIKISELWNQGKTIREIAAVMGVKTSSMAVWTVRLRNRFPALIPYRRAEHLRWKGKNFIQLKKERQLKEAA